jgi:CheY-like chemotaxis protein
MYDFATALCRPRSVLVVDSDPAVLALLSMVLEGPKTVEKPKIRVLRARSVKEATNMLNRPNLPVDLVLYNKSLSESEGQNFAERVRILRPQLPVMFMSAITEAQTIQIHGASGGTGMVRAVVAALERPRTPRNATPAHRMGHSIRVA